MHNFLSSAIFLEYFSAWKFCGLIKRFMNFHQTNSQQREMNLWEEVRKGRWRLLREYSNTFPWDIIGYVFRSALFGTLIIIQHVIGHIWSSIPIIAVPMDPSRIYDLPKSLIYPSRAPTENTRTSFTFLLLFIRHKNQKKGKETYNLLYFFTSNKSHFLPSHQRH